MATKTKEMTRKPFPLGNTLRDLAHLRASEVDVSGLLPTATTGVNDKKGTYEAEVEETYEFVREARKVLKMQNKGGVGEQGTRVEEVRNELEELLAGM